jgi:hypothetical protein
MYKPIFVFILPNWPAVIIVIVIRHRRMGGSVDSAERGSERWFDFRSGPRFHPG